MAAQLSTSDLRALEQSRRQLIQLMATIHSIGSSLHTTPTLPPLESLNVQCNILITNIQNIVSHINKEGNREVFDQVVAYPSTNFPGRDEGKEMVLQALLKKKLDLDIEGWVAEGKKEGEEIEGISGGRDDKDMSMEGTSTGREEEEDITKFWEWTYDWFGERVSRYAADEATAMYTAEEEEMGIEKVNTGNKADYEDESDSDEEGEGKGKEVEGEGVKGMEEKSLNDILRFWTTGESGPQEENSQLFRRK